MARAAARELVWGLRSAAAEIRRWREHAQQIPDPAIRRDALYALAHKRTHAHGAALFWTIPRCRNLHLLRLLVAYELIWDLLDNLSEHAAADGQTDGYHLHLAIPEAIDPSSPISDYYRRHPWRDDGGYLNTLVHFCQESCAHLPSYALVRPIAIEEARRAQVLAINHDPNTTRRDNALKAWVQRELPQELQGPWWELSGAASAPLAIHSLLALAAEPACTPEDADRVRSAYFPWVSAATTMLDSYVDQAEDRVHDDHSYIAHYPDTISAEHGLRTLVRRSCHETRSLPHGDRHALITAAMIAMYLSKDSALTPDMRAITTSYINAGGSLVRIMFPILRAWRTIYAQRSV